MGWLPSYKDSSRHFLGVEGETRESGCGQDEQSSCCRLPGGPGGGGGTAEWTSVPNPSALPAQVVGPASAWAEVALTPGVL